LNFPLDLDQLGTARLSYGFGACLVGEPVAASPRLCARGFLHQAGFWELAMPHMPPRWLCLSIALVLATTVAASAKPKAGAPTARPAPAIGFDGRWSVVIITDSGSCDRAYRYGVRISGGRIYYDGDSAAAINGQVDPRGNVVVNLRYGQASASGRGHLSESDGEGRWQGASTGSSCSGRWEAERRS
jgi:hypothetical protein